jgi:hypothetical protein
MVPTRSYGKQIRRKGGWRKWGREELWAEPRQGWGDSILT